MAVYTKISQADLSEHLKNYDIGKLLEYKEILEGIDNSNFIITTDKGKFILTIFESRINKEELPFFINFKLHLAKKGICCPHPVIDGQGKSIINFKGKKSSIVTFLSGHILKPQADGYYSNITVKHCVEVGKILSQLHLAAQDFKLKRYNELGISGFRNLFLKIENQLDSYQKNLKEEILAIINFLEKNWRDDLPSSAVHVDLFPDNVFFDDSNQVSGVIDFYFAATDALIYDFAVTVNAWCFDEKNNFVSEKFLALKNSYENLRKFQNNEIEFLKLALLAASLRFLLTRLHDMFFTAKDSLVKIKDPQEYLTKMRYFAKNL